MPQGIRGKQQINQHINKEAVMPCGRDTSGAKPEWFCSAFPKSKPIIFLGLLMITIAPCLINIYQSKFAKRFINCPLQEKKRASCSEWVREQIKANRFTGFKIAVKSFYDCVDRAKRIEK
jgi:hypothetical protein